MVDTSKYGFTISVSGSDVFATAKDLAKEYNSSEIRSMGLSGTITNEQMADVLQEWLPSFLTGRVENIVENLDDALENAYRSDSESFNEILIEHAGLVRAHYSTVDTEDEQGNMKYVLTTDKKFTYDPDMLYPEHGLFDEEEDALAKAYELNVALAATEAKGATK